MVLGQSGVFMVGTFGTWSVLSGTVRHFVLLGQYWGYLVVLGQYGALLVDI